MALSERTTRLYLKTPERKWLWLGGMAACALPMILGMWMLMLSSGPVWANVGNTFIFGSVFASLLGCWRVKRSEHEGFPTSSAFFGVGIWSATWAHFTAVMVWTGLIVVVTAIESKSEFSSTDIGEEIGIFFMFAFVNLILWVFVTIPLGTICARIFQSVATEERIVELAEEP